LPDLTEQPKPLPSRAAIGQTGPFAADDYAEGDIEHGKSDTGLSPSAIKTLFLELFTHFHLFSVLQRSREDAPGWLRIRKLAFRTVHPAA
jgi:hypothetical protein